MKKKRLMLFAASVALILILLAASAAVMINKGYGASQGRFLESKNGQAMLIVDNSPIVMSDRTGRSLFDGLDTGDEIFVIHTGIEESYPAQTCAYAVFKLSNGTVEDIPQTVTDALAELGWL